MSTRRLLVLAPALAMLMLVAACATSGPKLDGVWECVSPAPARGGGRSVKIIADGHFAFGCQSADGRTDYAGGGTCSYDGRTYTENVAYHWVPELVGETIVFDCTLKDGLWYHKARPLMEGAPCFIDEIWRRVAEPGPAR